MDILSSWFDAVAACWPHSEPPRVLRLGAHSPASAAPGTFAPVTDRVRPGERVLMVVSDQTRKTGLAQHLNAFLDQWQATGLGLEDLRFLVACGSHRAPTAGELRGIFGPEAWRRLGGGRRVSEWFQRQRHPRTTQTIVQAPTNDAARWCGPQSGTPRRGTNGRPH